MRRLEREIYMQADKDSFVPSLAMTATDAYVLLVVNPLCYVKNMRNLAEDTPSE